MNSFIGKLKSAADLAGVSASSAQEKIVQEYLPKIVAVLREKAGPALLDILADTERLSDLARGGYQALPMPVRLVMKEQAFVDFVVSRQDGIVDALRAQMTQSTTPEMVAEYLPATYLTPTSQNYSSATASLDGQPSAAELQDVASQNVEREAPPSDSPT